MEILIKTARASYGIMIAALSAQQIFYKAFRPVILPSWHLSFPGFAFFVYLVSAIFIAGGVAIVFNKKAKKDEVYAREVNMSDATLGPAKLLFTTGSEVIISGYLEGATSIFDLVGIRFSVYASFDNSKLLVGLLRFQY